jgi:hypothetical protein
MKADPPKPGNQVVIARGIFSGVRGVIQAIDPEHGTAKVLVSIFGRELAVEISLDDSPLPMRIPRRGRHRQVLESYLANWHARGIFQERLNVRIYRCSDRCRIVGTTFELTDSGDWRTSHRTTRLLEAGEWEQCRDRLAADFWPLPSRDNATPCLDGEVWTMEGCREDAFHLVTRHTGSVVDGTGEDFFRLCQFLARLAGLHRFDFEQA